MKFYLFLKLRLLITHLGAFLPLVFQPLMSAQARFLIGAWQPSGLDNLSLIQLLPIQHLEDLSTMRSEPAGFTT